MSGFQKGFLNKPNNVEKKSQENSVKAPIDEKKEKQKAKKMWDENFERMSRLAINKFLREHFEIMRREGRRIYYQTALNCFFAYSREENIVLMRELYKKVSNEIVLAKLFNECALEMLEREEEEAGYKPNEAEQKARLDFARLCNTTMVEILGTVVNNGNVFHPDTKYLIQEKFESHPNQPRIQKACDEEEKASFILERLSTHIVWDLFIEPTVLSTDEFEYLAGIVMNDCARLVIERLKNVEKEQNVSGMVMGLLLDEWSFHKDGLKLSNAAVNNSEQMDIHIRQLCDQIEKVRAFFENRAENLDPKVENMTKEEFTDISFEMFDDVNRIYSENYKKKINGMLSSEEFSCIVRNATYRHKSWSKISAAMELNKSYKNRYEVMRLRKFWMQAKKNSDPIFDNKNPPQNFDDLATMCHSVFKDCYNLALEKIKNVDGKAFTEFDYVGRLSDEIYEHNDTAQILKEIKPIDDLNKEVAPSDGKMTCDKLKIFNSLVLKYSNELMKEHKKICEPKQENKSPNIEKEPVSENLVPKELPKKEEEKEKEKGEESKRDECQGCSIKLEKMLTYDKSLQESMEKVEELETVLLVERGKCITLREEKDNLEIKLKSNEEKRKETETTMAENLEKEKEISRKLAEVLNLEKENAIVLAKNLIIEKEKLERMYEEKKQWEKCVQDLKKEEEKCESLRKEKTNLEKKLEKSEKTMAENMKKEKENSKELADDLKIEKENSRIIAENLEIERSKLEILEKDIRYYEDSWKWFEGELRKSEQLTENLQQKRENEKKEKERMASKIVAMEEFQKINNKETEEWKAQIMKMFEKQTEELKIAKQELKKYQSKK